ncbi:MAG TPA: MFS transporter [Methylomirabilota bacterium]|jgi:MFS family permease|nr:MFS transporter [Methylomirabilota bacterium]
MTSHPSSSKSRWGVLALVTGAFAFGALSVLSVAPLAPFLLEALALSRAQVGFFLPAVYLGGVLMALPAGWLTDRLGVRLTLALGQAVIGVMVMAAALAWSLPALLACLVLGGFGFSVLNPATGKAVIEWFPPRRRGVAMGIKQTGLTLGGLAGALTLPAVALALGWRWALGLAGAASLLSSLVVAVLYREPPRAPGTEAIVWPRVRELSAFMRRPGVIVVFGSGLALSTAQSSVLAYLVLYGKETFGMSAIAAGQFLALAQVGGTASRLAWGAISDRFFGGRRRPGVVLNALLGSGAYAAFALGESLPTTLAIPLAVVAGAGAFGWVGLYFALVAEIGGAHYAGLLTGLAVAFAWSGVLIGPPIFGVLLETTGGYAAPWLVLSAIALAVAVMLPRLRPLVQRD